MTSFGIATCVLQPDLATTISNPRHGEQAKCHGHGDAFSNYFIGLATRLTGAGA
jgi:hypothetical protein